MHSSVGLLTYLVSAPAARGQGLARQLCAKVLAVVGCRSRRGESSPVVLECHRAGVPDAVMNSGARLQAYERMGWLGLHELPFVAPAVSDGMDTIANPMCLLVHSSATGSLQTDAAPAPEDVGLDAAVLREWLLEYWAACYSEDLSPLRMQFEYLESKQRVPTVPPSQCVIRE